MSPDGAYVGGIIAPGPGIAADPRTLRELDGAAAGDDVLLSLAVRFGSVRLIDNRRHSGGHRGS